MGRARAATQADTVLQSKWCESCVGRRGEEVGVVAVGVDLEDITMKDCMMSKYTMCPSNGAFMKYFECSDVVVPRTLRNPAMGNFANGKDRIRFISAGAVKRAVKTEIAILCGPVLWYFKEQIAGISFQTLGADFCCLLLQRGSSRCPYSSMVIFKPQ